MSFTKMEKQLVANAIDYFKSINFIISPRLVALVENDETYKNEFDARAEKFNKSCTGRDYRTADFDTQIGWDIESFRKIKAIREWCC